MSDFYLDKKYVGIVSTKLRNYKVKQEHPFLANFSCCFCGDSATSKHKARGYFVEKKGNIFFYCHNCNIPPKSVPSFLKAIDPIAFQDYLREKFSVDKKPDRTEEKINTLKSQVRSKITFDSKSSLKPISRLPEDHVAKQYILQRKIPSEFMDKLFYVDKFKEFVNSLIPGKFNSLQIDSPRIIIPFLNQSGKLFGFQGRSFLSGKGLSKDLRYISIVLNDEYPKIYGLNTVDQERDVYVLEGAFDSMFVDNSIATCDANYLKAEELLPKANKIYVPDKDRRNKEVLANIEKLIKHKCRVCLMPSYVGGKDINQMIIDGKTKEEIKSIIDKNVFQGLELQMKFNEWKRI